MQLVILGNGFDLASGLKTKYQDFFNWRKENLKGAIDEITQNCKCIQKELDIAMRADHAIVVEYHQEAIMTFKDNIFKIVEMYKINIFDLIFYALELHNEDQEVCHWNDVESVIGLVVMDDLKRCKLNATRDERDYLFKRGYDNKLRTLYSDPYLDGDEKVKESMILKMVISNIMAIKANNFNGDKDYYQKQIFKELIEWECCFQKYLEKAVINKINENQDIYMDNLKLLLSNQTEDFSILNFNYTAFNHDNEVNIHGRYDDITIFGIDPLIKDGDDLKLISATATECIFTKTYRKLTEGHRIKTMILPKEVDTIIIFGHSLSHADYSYFQSIFDFYNIYESNVSVCFKYINFENSDNAKFEKVQQVTELMQKYGKSIPNARHGDNLQVKMMVSGRLFIQEIKDFKKIQN